MTARERIIDTIAETFAGGDGEEPLEYQRGDGMAILDAIPPTLLWEWLIETGNIEQVDPYQAWEEDNGVPVFRLVAETMEGQQ